MQWTIWKEQNEWHENSKQNKPGNQLRGATIGRVKISEELTQLHLSGSLCATVFHMLRHLN